MREERRRMKRNQQKRKDAANRRAETNRSRYGQSPGRGPTQRSEFFKETPEVAPPTPLPKVTSARQIAFRVLDDHGQSGQFVGPLIEGVLWSAQLSHPAERRLATELANGVVRRQLTLDAILKKFVDRPQDQVEPRLWTLLRLGAYQLVLASRIKVHAAVAETVELARWCGEERWTGFLNGVLRTILRSVEAAAENGDTGGIVTRYSTKAVPLDPEPVDEDSPGELGEQRYRLLDREVFPGLHDIPRFVSAAFGLPLWLVIRWDRRFDQQRLFRLASSFNFRPPLTLRVNSLRTSREDLLALLRDSVEVEVETEDEAEAAEVESEASETTDVDLALETDSEATSEEVVEPQLDSETVEAAAEDSATDETPDEPVTVRKATFGEGRQPGTIWCRGAGNPVTLPGFAEGLFAVQDETAMSAAALLDPQPGQRVLDLCAAPGTKSTHLAELMKNEGSVLAVDSDAVRLERVPENAERLGMSIIETATVRDDLSDLPEGPFDAILVDVLCSNTGVLGKRPEVRSRLKRGDVEELAELQLKLLTAAASRLAPGGRLVYSTCSIEPEENSGVISRFLQDAVGIRLEETREFFPGEPSDGGFQTLLIREA
jgi:16S rRNA C967 or C1407 C5-methylase (RsmB/RsmF family)